MRKQEEDHKNLTIHINGDRSFIINQKLLCSFSGTLKKMIDQLNHNSIHVLHINGFPGGPDSFELTARFCYNNGRITMNPSNICILHSSAMFLEMTEELSPCNLLHQAETYLDGLFYWTWQEILTSLKSLEAFVSEADSSGLLHRLVTTLLAKISTNSGMFPSSSPSRSSSPISSASPVSRTTCSLSREWWFEDLTVLHPKIIEKIMKLLRAYGDESKNLTLMRFILLYLKAAANRKSVGVHHCRDKDIYGGLVETAVSGAVAIGTTVFSCRGLFWVLRILCSMGMNEDCRGKIESLIGSVLDQASLDDLLVPGHQEEVYDVDLVLRLAKTFVGLKVGEERLWKVGRLMDQYLGEVSPDQRLKVFNFQALVESLPDEARDCFDGVYRAIDIYLQAHPGLLPEDCAKLCQCLNYKKLSVEACKDLAKNPRILPHASVRPMSVTKQSRSAGLLMNMETPRLGMHHKGRENELKDQLRANLERVQRRVLELERACKEMQGGMLKTRDTATINYGNSPSCPSGIWRQYQHHQHRSGRGLSKLC